MNKQDIDLQIQVLMLSSAGLDVDEVADRLPLERDAVLQILGHRPTLTLRQGDVY